ALEMLARGPLRGAVTEPTRVLMADGRVVDVPSYTAWWLRPRARVGGHAPGGLRTADAEAPGHGPHDTAPASMAPPVTQGRGVGTTVTGLLEDPDGPDDLLERLADPARHVERVALRDLWTALAEVDPDLVTPPLRVRAVHEEAIVVADADDAVVLDSPDLLPLVDAPLVLAPANLAEQLADVLDLDTAGDRVEGTVDSVGQIRTVPEEVELFLDLADRTYFHHQELT